MIKKKIIPVILAASFMTAAIPAYASSDTVCKMMGDIGYDAAQMRQNGASQKETARYLSSAIGGFFSAYPQLGPTQDRQLAASYLGQAATTILRVVYTPAPKELSNPYFAQGMAEAAYNVCMQGYFE